MHLKFKRENGFTLIEVLLALFITAILITILSVVFNTGLRAYRQGKDLLEITRKGQLILGQITRELTGAMVKQNIIPFVGTGSSVFFMASIPNSSNIDLCEIGYRRNGNVLQRHILTYGAGGFEYPNAVDYNELNFDTLCEGVTAFNLSYYSISGGWGTGWSSSTTNLPTMVEVSVTIQGEYPTNAPVQSKTFTTWIYLPNST